MSYAVTTKYMPHFTDFEVQPVMGLDENNNPVKPENEAGQHLQIVPCDSEEDKKYLLCWSVYGCMVGAGVDCLADYETEEEARGAEDMLYKLESLNLTVSK